MARQIVFHPIKEKGRGRESLTLPPGRPIEVDDEMYEWCKKSKYIQWFVDKGKIEISDVTPKPGISEDPKTDQISEKEKPEELKPKDEEEAASVGRKTGHSIKQSTAFMKNAKK